jgi:hypothetical protein
MSSPRIIYTPHPDATPQDELNVLANVYRFVVDWHAKTEAACGSGLDNEAKESKHDCPVTPKHIR